MCLFGLLGECGFLLLAWRASIFEYLRGLVAIKMVRSCGDACALQLYGVYGQSNARILTGSSINVHMLCVASAIGVFHGGVFV